MKRRKKIEVLTQPCVKVFRKLGLKPNTVSLLGLWFAGLSCYFYAMGDFTLGTAMLLINGYLDLVDGDLARSTGANNKKGEFVDNSIDRFADSLIFFGLFLGRYTYGWIAVLAIITTLITSYLGGLSYRLFTGRKEYRGFGRDVRIVILIITGFLNLLHPGIILISIMNIYTILLRFCDIYRKV